MASAICDVIVGPRKTREVLGTTVQIGIAQHLVSMDPELEV